MRHPTGKRDDSRRFLEAGPPPVYLTFGSMLAGEPNPLEITTLMINAVKKAGTRAMIQSKWDELGAIELIEAGSALRAPGRDTEQPKSTV